MSQQPLPPSDEVATAPDAAVDPTAATGADPANTDNVSVDAPVEDASAVVASADNVDANTPAGDEPFSQLLEVRPPPEPGGLAIGQRVRGKILSIGDEQVIVSLSGRPDAILPVHELRGPDGTLLLRVDDPVSAIVQSVELPAQLTLGKKRGLLNLHKLRVAHEEKQPVNGTVRAVNKGGFEVRVHGARGFCPLSQIDYGFTQEQQSYIGQNYRFRVLRWENGGRNIVLSRRAILKEEAESKAVETRRRLEVGAEFDGVVKRVQPFGAFVDIGGLEGLLHVSRMGRGHVTDPAGVVTPGQTLKVRVTRIDNPESGKERIALAAADLGPDPWETARETLTDGAIVRGRVVRLAEFGAFVNLLPGIDGLVHVSELPPLPENAPGPLAVQPGDEIEVRIVRVDLEKKRVSLSTRLQPPAARPPREMRDAQDSRPGRDGREARRPRRDRDRDRDTRDRDRDATPFATGGSLTHNMAEQLGALRRKLQVRP